MRLGYDLAMSSDEIFKANAFLTRETLRLALDSDELGVWLEYLDTGRAEWSGPMKRIMGISPAPDEAESLFFDHVHPEDRERAHAEISRARDAAGGGDCETEFRIVTPQGAVRWIALRGRRVADGDEFFIRIVKDVTEQTLAEAARDHQTVLLHEVNHRVKNSLQLVSSLVRLQARRIGDAKIRRQLEDATGRIATIAQIHHRLYADQDTKSIDFGSFLGQLCSELQGSSPGCSLQVFTTPLVLDVDRAVPLALIVNELVANAFKYAYPGGGGRVAVRIERCGSADFRLSVADEGVGLPEGFSVDGGNSLGMTLIGSMVAQLRGRIEIARGERGATFIVTAPLAD
jgi:PAS domain S-box-containing protein